MNAPALGAPNAAIAAAYWLRLATHLLLLPALIVLLSDAACAAVVRRGLLIATTALAVLGLLQILILPNMSDLAGLAPRSPARPAGVLGEGGWDPHAGRLVSTWLDPNFMGAFFAMMLPYLLSCLRPSRALSDARQNRWVLFALGLSGAALILTQSRSAFVSLALALLLLSPLFVSRLMRSAASPRRSGQRLAYASAALLIVGSLALGGFFMRERLAGLLRVDDTVALRAAALSAVWPLAHQHAWLGVGYNAYQFAAARAGIISDFTIHSRAGADNSLLTLWVTVGLPGLLFFLLPFCAIAQMLLRAVVYSPRASAACGALAALTVLFIDSQFINSLLYAHLLITLALIVALALIAPAR